MSRDGLAAATRFLVLALSALYSLAAIAGLVLVDFTSTRDPVFWTVLPLLVPIAVAAIGTCSVGLARRPATPA